MTSQRLPFAINVRLSADQRQLLEETAGAHDLTLSGAIRHLLDVELDRPVNDSPGAPSRRQLMREDRGEVVISGQAYEVTKVERASA